MADIWITQTEIDSINYVIDNCNFNRIGSGGGSHYCTNCILLEQNAAAVCGLAVNNCSFQDFLSYTPSSGRPYINITSTGNFGRNFIALNNFYAEVVEIPNFAALSGAAYQSSWIGNLNVGALAYPYRGALVYRSTNQTITNATPVAISWSNAQYDTDSIWAGGSPTRLAVPAGVNRVRLSGGAIWVSAANGLRLLNVKKNGGSFAGQSQSTESVSPTATAVSLNVTTPVLAVSGGDYFELFVNQSSGGVLDVAGGSTGPTWFAMEILR
jgi:hypothetical protein